MNERRSDETTYSSLSVWTPVLNLMRAGSFDDQAIEDVISKKGEWSPEHIAALVLAYVNDAMDAGADSARAALKAARQYYLSVYISPAQVCAIAEGYLSWSDSMDTVIQEELDARYTGIRHEWLNEDGRRQIASWAKKPGQIWISERGLPGVWVFEGPTG